MASLIIRIEFDDGVFVGTRNLFSKYNNIDIEARFIH